jgi:F-type H+-transporting ATPase subunit a
MIFGIVSTVLGLFGVLQAFGILTDVPILAYGIPAVLSCYFDIFSGFVQAYVFTLLTMVYISASLPGPDEQAE